MPFGNCRYNIEVCYGRLKLLCEKKYGLFVQYLLFFKIVFFKTVNLMLPSNHAERKVRVRYMTLITDLFTPVLSH